MIPEWLKYEIKERWETFIQRLEDDPKLLWGIVGASVLLLVLVIVFMIADGDSRPEINKSKKAWFYDLNTAELFVGKASENGPLKAPSGPLPNGEPAGVKAHVFVYVNDPNKNDLVIGYLEKPDPNAKEVSDSNIWGEGKLVRSLEDANWVEANSIKGKTIRKAATERNDKGQVARYWVPQ